MKAFITKYALTQGILEVEGELDHDGEYLIWKNGECWNKQYTARRDFCATLPGALAVAENMRLKKIASLEKQVTKLRNCEIKVRHL